MELAQIADIPEAEIEALLDGLRGYNRQYIDKSGRGSVGVFCCDRDVTIVGGIIASAVGFCIYGSVKISGVAELALN